MKVKFSAVSMQTLTPSTKALSQEVAPTVLLRTKSFPSKLVATPESPTLKVAVAPCDPSKGWSNSGGTPPIGLTN